MMPMRGILQLAPLAAACLPAEALADAAAPAPVSPLSGAGIAQMVLALVVVLAAIVLAAWLLRRLRVVPGAAAGALKVLGGVAVGQRERVVLVEIGGTWLVLGVAPGRVNALHAMARSEHLPAQATGTTALPRDFALWLKRALARRENG